MKVAQIKVVFLMVMDALLTNIKSLTCALLL